MNVSVQILSFKILLHQQLFALYSSLPSFSYLSKQGHIETGLAGLATAKPILQANKNSNLILLAITNLHAAFFISDMT